MLTNRQLFEQVLENFEDRADSAICVPLYYSESAPGGCAVGCLFSLEARRSLQAKCEISLDYSIDEIWESDNTPELDELRGKYSLIALKAVQLLHDGATLIQHFKDALDSALLNGVMYTGLELGYVSLDEEIDELH